MLSDADIAQLPKLKLGSGLVRLHHEDYYKIKTERYVRARDIISVHCDTDAYDIPVRIVRLAYGSDFSCSNPLDEILGWMANS